jgi:glycosyltransferase involved in cell wall biosynthesis
MRVACVVPYPLDTAPGQRFRLEQWAKPLAAQGIRLEFFPFLDREAMARLYRRGEVWSKARSIVAGARDRLQWALRQAREFDVAVIFREAIPLGLTLVETILARRLPTVFDFDDAIWLPNVSPANRRFQSVKGFAKVNRALAMCSAVSAGCRHLFDHARQHNPRVYLVPTSIDLDLYSPPRAHAPAETLTVGWTGSLTTSPYVELIAEPLRRAAARVPMELVVFGGEVRIPGVRVRCEPWSATGEVPLIRTFDVGLKPLPRTDWVRGKCPMKELQYMALGIPPVATRFGSSTESIEHGRTGLLCDADDDWVEALSSLRDPARRAAIGGAARQVVEERYSSTVAAAAFARVLQAAHDHFHRRASGGTRGPAQA